MDEPSNKPLKWSEISKDKRESIAIFYQELKLLIEFGNKANQKLFIHLYGKQTGEHLWTQFRKIDNLFDFMKYLDVENRQILLSNIYGYNHKEQYSSGHPLYVNC